MDILTMGEVLIDLTQKGKDENGIARFAAFPGGAPANVAVAAARLGAKTGFMGKVGKDSFGKDLKAVLDREGVDTSFVFECAEHPTTMAIVHVDEEGERDFTFYRDPGADTQLTEEEALSVLSLAPLPRILHFGSLSLTHSPAREACLSLIRAAGERGILISYDPNYRAPLWPDEETAVKWMMEPLPLVDVLKVSDGEMLMMTGTDDVEEGSRILLSKGIKLVLVTLGGEGSFYRYAGGSGILPSVSHDIADTNGAGDTFFGALLCQIADRLNNGAGDFSGIPDEDLSGMVMYSNRAAAVTCSRSGAIPAMPTPEEVVNWK